MRTNKITTTLAAFAALATIAGPLAGTAAAKPKIKTTQKTTCKQNLPNGNVVEYEVGTKITVIENGKAYKFRCSSNGEWVRTALEVVNPVLPVAPVGTLGASLPNE